MNPVSALGIPPAAPLTMRGEIRPEWHQVLSPQALEFVATLAQEFQPLRNLLLQARIQRQAHFDAGHQPGFLQETADLRATDWTVSPLPPDLLNRQVEITGPVDRKMIINALNSGANMFMADFEDSNAPSWENNVSGQLNLMEAVRGKIQHVDEAKGKTYQLNDSPAVLLVRPRGLHLDETHLEISGEPVSASLFDFGLYFFHNAWALLEKGSGPYFYLPKLESHTEARWWNSVFLKAQELLRIPRGSVKATVLIETLPAAFEMDEILYELREHSAGLNCGRWDYIFSVIKTWRNHPDRILPDRAQVGMNQPMMRAYTQLLVKTCHRRGAPAMGGMAAQIPIKHDVEANTSAMAKVRTDKEREVRDGHDGTWVAHPGLIPMVKEIFQSHITGPNQLNCLREDLEAWLRGVGCVPLYSLMEDAATAEISRMQCWQWIRHGAALTTDEGRQVEATIELLQEVIAEEMRLLGESLGIDPSKSGCFATARDLFFQMSIARDPVPFLTLPAYPVLISHPKQPTR